MCFHPAVSHQIVTKEDNRCQIQNSDDNSHLKRGLKRLNSVNLSQMQTLPLTTQRIRKTK